MTVASLQNELEARLASAFQAAGVPVDLSPLVRPAYRLGAGDFQANGVMAAAGKMRVDSKQLAASVLAHLQVQDLAEEPSISGPGFINIRLRNDYLGEFLEAWLPSLLTSQINAAGAERIVVDLSSPNLAKEMHVGHLRSTIIGDAIARVLGHLGHHVIRQNHVGDWGTQFGMLIAYMQRFGNAVDTELTDLEKFYQAARHQFDTDTNFADQARHAVVALQQGDPDCLRLWHQFTRRSMAHCQAVYERLGVALSAADTRGESAYNDDLAGIVEACESAGLVVESEGAKCIFFDDIKGFNDEPLPLIIQKSDGAYLYATTDLAAIRYRTEVLQVDRVLYFVDARQSLHFRQVLQAAAQAGFSRPNMTLQHLPFGTVMGADGKPLKTRDGGVIKLNDLLNEAERRAKALVHANNPKLSADQCSTIACVVGIGAVKYADLSRNPSQDYKFDWDSILSFEGNTGPYIQYAYTRILSIFRQAGLAITDTLPPMKSLDEPPERALAIHLGCFGVALEEVAAKSQPHGLCSYLFELAARFSTFYEHCPVLKTEQPTRDNRLRLCQLTAHTLHVGLDLLGIQTTERM